MRSRVADVVRGRALAACFVFRSSCEQQRQRPVEDRRNIAVRDAVPQADPVPRAASRYVSRETVNCTLYCSGASGLTSDRGLASPVRAGTAARRQSELGQSRGAGGAAVACGDERLSGAGGFRTDDRSGWQWPERSRQFPLFRAYSCAALHCKHVLVILRPSDAAPAG